MKAQWEARGVALLFLKPWRYGGGWLMPRLAAVPPGMTRYPLYGKLGEPQGPSGWGQKFSLLLGFDPWTFQL